MIKVSKIKNTIQFHKNLNPMVWKDHEMLPKVRLTLLKNALEFYKFLDIPNLVVRDIVLVGSNASYNYTKMSDLDVHLLVDFSGLACSDLAENVFTTKKALWSKTYDVKIHGHSVELYVEDKNHPAKSNGRYSILHGKWIKEPNPIKPNEDDSAIISKAKYFIEEINELIHNDPSEEEIEFSF